MHTYLHISNVQSIMLRKGNHNGWEIPNIFKYVILYVNFLYKVHMSLHYTFNSDIDKR